LICPRLEAPIVLAHGLFGYDRIGVGRLTIVSYFRGIPEFLRGGGNRVVVTRVPAISGVKHRAKVLAEQIERACPGEAVHLIGHSMGGLDARQLMADLAWSGRVLSLTTIGTPHLGSALADCARARVGPVYRLLRSMKIEHRGFLDVTRRAARAVNRNGSSPGKVPCFSVAGAPEFHDVCWPMRPFYEVLEDLEGPNDGLVSVESALGFGIPLPVWPVDHLRQLNWLSPPAGPSSPASIRMLYCSLLTNLVELGFAAREPLIVPEPVTRPTRRPLLKNGGVLLLDPILHSLRTRRPVEKHGHRHVAEDVGRGPAPVDEPVNGQEHGDLVRGQPDGREDQR
jgi:triacylglycerol lipase